MESAKEFSKEFSNGSTKEFLKVFLKEFSEGFSKIIKDFHKLFSLYQMDRQKMDRQKMNRQKMTKLQENSKKCAETNDELNDNASKKSNEAVDGKIRDLVNRERTENDYDRTMPPLLEIVRGELDRDRIFEKFGVSVRETKNGLGVIAERDFNIGETVGYVDGIPVFDPNYSSVWCIDGGSCVLEPFAPFCYLNHSCEPNSGFFRENSESDPEQVLSPHSDQCLIDHQNQSHFDLQNLGHIDLQNQNYVQIQEQCQTQKFDPLKSKLEKSKLEKSKLEPDQLGWSQVTVSKEAKSENIFANEKNSHQKERQVVIDENGVEFYWDTCARENCFECPDAGVCQSYHGLTEEEQRRGANVRVEALRTIRKGEEITVDYAWPASWAIPCHCGSKNCRGWIVDKNERHLLND